MFQKATKTACKLRMAVFGPSGAGKTFTSLRVAKGLGGRIAVMDSERRSASKYSDRFDFDVCEVMDRTIEGYSKIIDDAAAAGYGTLIIDSLSHCWHELLQEVEKLAQAKYRGNTWSAWNEGTPKQRRLINTITEFPGHVMVTMRSKTEWLTEVSANGKTRPVRIGLSPEQGKGIEYEFDLLMEITTDHLATIIKDRTGKFQDKIIEKPGEDFGVVLAAWLADGKPATTAEAPKTDPVAEQLSGALRLSQLIQDRGITKKTQDKWCQHFKVESLAALPDDAVTKIIAKIESTPQTKAA